MELLLLGAVGYGAMRYQKSQKGDEAVPATRTVTPSTPSKSANEQINFINANIRPHIIAGASGPPVTIGKDRMAPAALAPAIVQYKKVASPAQPAAVVGVGLGNGIDQRAKRLEQVNTQAKEPIGRNTFEFGANPITQSHIMDTTAQDKIQAVATRLAHHGALKTLLDLGVIEAQQALEAVHGKPASSKLQYVGNEMIRIQQSLPSGRSKEHSYTIINPFEPGLHALQNAFSKKHGRKPTPTSLPPNNLTTGAIGREVKLNPLSADEARKLILKKRK